MLKSFFSGWGQLALLLLRGAGADASAAGLSMKSSALGNIQGQKSDMLPEQNLRLKNRQVLKCWFLDREQKFCFRLVPVTTTVAPMQLNFLLPGH